MKLPGRIGGVVAGLCFAIAATSAAAQKPPRYGFPQLRAGQFWVSSVPVGLEVYAGSKPTGKPLGRTPLVVSSKRIGSHLTISVQKEEYGGSLPDQFDLVDPSAERTHSTIIRAGERDEDRSRALTYRVDPRKKRTLIALFQSKSSSLSELASRCPPGENFRFRDDLAGRDLAARGVPAVFLPEAIRLLHRGGKVALPGRDGWLVAEVTPSGRLAVMTKAAVTPAQ